MKVVLDGASMTLADVYAGGSRRPCGAGRFSSGSHDQVQRVCG